MSEENQKNLPDYNVFHVAQEEQGAHWVKIGAAWTNQDGEGFSLTLNSLPINFDGKLVLRKPKAS